MNFKSYPKIPSFGYDGTEDILDGEVTITPKIDGSNVSIWLGNGTYKLGRRTDWLSESDKGFAPFMDFVRSKWDESLYLRAAAERENWLVIFGEFSNNQNKLKYDIKIPIVVFDVAEVIYDEEGTMNFHFDFYDYNAMKSVADQADLDIVPALYQGSGLVLDSQRIIDRYLNKPSFLGGPNEEGVVVKSYGRKTRYGRNYFVKLVTAEYSERQKTKMKPPKMGNAVSQWAVAEFFNEARLFKAIQKIKESGEWVEPEAKKNVGTLIQTVCKDIYSEHYEEIATKAAKVAWKETTTLVARQVAPTLDKILLEESNVT